MSSSRVWVPAGKYDSIKPLWQDQYVWCPLPVDASLPLHQTSFLDINEKEASAARSRGSTIVSQPKASLVDGNPSTLRSGNDQKGGWNAQETTPPVLDVGDQALEITRQSLPKARARAQLRASATELMGPRPDSLKEIRLHSFHLLSTRDKGLDLRNSPIQTPKKSQSREGEEEKHREDLAKRIERSGLFEKLDEVDDRLPVHASRKRRRAAWPPRQKTGRSRTKGVLGLIVDERHDPSQPTQKSPLRKPLAPVDPKTLNQTKRTSSLCLSVELNLEVEIQLKARITGDLTLTLSS